MGRGRPRAHPRGPLPRGAPPADSLQDGHHRQLGILHALHPGPRGPVALCGGGGGGRIGDTLHRPAAAAEPRIPLGGAADVFAAGGRDLRYVDRFLFVSKYFLLLFIIYWIIMHELINCRNARTRAVTAAPRRDAGLCLQNRERRGNAFGTLTGGVLLERAHMALEPGIVPYILHSRLPKKLIYNSKNMLFPSHKIN